MKSGFDDRLRHFVLTELACLLLTRANVMAEIEDGIEEIEQFEIQQTYGDWG